MRLYNLGAAIETIFVEFKVLPGFAALEPALDDLLRADFLESDDLEVFHSKGLPDASLDHQSGSVDNIRVSLVGRASLSASEESLGCRRTLRESQEFRMSGQLPEELSE